MENQAIDKYIWNLDYDYRTLLTVPGINETTTIPKKNKKDKSVIICTQKKQEITNQVKDVAILSPSSGTIFPGALVIGNNQLAQGTPQAISVKRRAIEIATDLPNSDSKTIPQPSYASVKEGVDEIVDQWLTQREKTGNDHVARLSYSVTKAYSKGQLATKLGIRTEWAGNEIKSQLEVKNSQSQSVTVALFKQIFYTATYNIPDNPSALFADTVTLDDLKNRIDNNRPPAYVKSVDYGRIIMVRMTTDSSETETDLENTLKMVTGQGTKFSAEMESHYKKISENSSFDVIILGGGAKLSAQVFNGANEIEQIKPLISAGIQLSKNNPGYPISYTVNYLKDNSLAVMNLTSTYYETECVEYYDGFVKVHNDSACVGNFQINWTETDDDGRQVPKSYNSGDKNKGFTYTLHLPGDATGIHIVGKAAKFIKTWQTVIDTRLQGPTNKTYKMKGSAFKLTQEIV